MRLKLRLWLPLLVLLLGATLLHAAPSGESRGRDSDSGSSSGGSSSSGSSSSGSSSSGSSSGGCAFTPTRSRDCPGSTSRGSGCGTPPPAVCGTGTKRTCPDGVVRYLSGSTTHSERAVCGPCGDGTKKVTETCNVGGPDYAILLTRTFCPKYRQNFTDLCTHMRENPPNCLTTPAICNGPLGSPTIQETPATDSKPPKSCYVCADGNSKCADGDLPESQVCAE